MNGLTMAINDFTPRRKRLGYRKSMQEAPCPQLLFVDSPATGWRAACAPLRIGMERLLVVDRDFFAELDVSQSKEQDMAVQSSHEGIWLAGVIDVVRSVAAARAVQAETPVNVADAQDLTIASAPASFKV